MSKLSAMKFWRSLVCTISLLIASIVSITNVQAQTDAYSIQVAVVDRSVEEQQNAYQIGMRSVLLANSGDKTLLNRDDVRAGLSSADTYVESFRYESPAPGTVISRDTPLTDSVRSTGKATQLMMIQFNRELIQQLIRPSSASTAAPESESDEAFNPFGNVSSALMWLIIEDGGKQILVSGAAGQNVMARTREIAGGVGISLSFPAGDDNDTQAVSIEDIKTANLDAVAAAASRYAQPLTLAAHLTRTRTGGWEGVWLKTAAGLQENQVISSGSLDEALQQGVLWLKPQSQSSAANSGAAVQPGFQSGQRSNLSSAEGLVWVSPLRETKNYAEVMQLFTSIDGVTAVYPKEVLGGGMVFAILPRSALPLVSSAASTRDWLRQAATPSSANESRFAGGISVSFEYLR